MEIGQIKILKVSKLIAGIIVITSHNIVLKLIMKKIWYFMDTGA